METKLQRLRHYAELLRRPEDRCVQPKGMRKGSVSASRRRDRRECQQSSSFSMHCCLISNIFYFYYKKSNRFEL
jgi:hypothetical protein